jgi:hypothetical protein
MMSCDETMRLTREIEKKDVELSRLTNKSVDVVIELQNEIAQQTMIINAIVGICEQDIAPSDFEESFAEVRMVSVLKMRVEELESRLRPIEIIYSVDREGLEAIEKHGAEKFIEENKQVAINVLDKLCHVALKSRNYSPVTSMMKGED